MVNQNKPLLLPTASFEYLITSTTKSIQILTWYFVSKFKLFGKLGFNLATIKISHNLILICSTFQ